jgi:single-stranded DNA-binding protein|nr:MAG TPA: Single strand binding protein [Caudoviricetes sp.]
MSAEITVTGNLTRDPEPAKTKTGELIVRLGIAATRRQFDKKTNEWTDDGAPLYINASFFGDSYEYIMGLVGKGDQVTISGTLVLREWESKKGAGQSLEIRFPKFLGYMKKGDRAPQSNRRYRR